MDMRGDRDKTSTKAYSQRRKKKKKSGASIVLSLRRGKRESPTWLKGEAQNFHPLRNQDSRQTFIPLGDFHPCKIVLTFNSSSNHIAFPNKKIIPNYKNHHIEQSYILSLSSKTLFTL